MTAERLQRALARAGFGSRRSCEELIVAGKVKVNGRVATLGDKVEPSTDTVVLNGSIVNLDPNVRYLALHKPAGVVTTMKDPQGRRDLRSLLPPEGPRVFPVGRLDRDTEGLLLLTNDGDLANKLLHPRYAIEKEYLAEVAGRPASHHLARLRAGVELEDGPAKVASVRIVDARPDRGQLRVVMTEGRKREVRRLLQAVGLPVSRLVRLRVGPVTLATLRPGAIRPLTTDEVLALQKTVAKAERRAAHAAANPPEVARRSDRRGG
jgi:23S rRNA pseudouridine2605 synthase